MFKLYILLLFSAGLIFAAKGQDPILSQRLQNRQNLSEIMAVVNEYYKEPATALRLGAKALSTQLKHWQRWEWFMSSRLDGNGNLVNTNQKLFEANGMKLERAESFVNQADGMQTNSTAGTWALLGPTNTTSGIGRIDRLAFHPTDANTVYAGSTAGGLWRTTNAGDTWSNLSPNISSPAISGIAIDPTNTNTIYILTGDGDSDIGGLVDDYGYMRLSIGVLKSTNGGATWQKTGDFPGVNFSTLVGYRLIMHPTSNQILYACTSQGLFVTINGGTSWGLSNGYGRFYDMAFQPGSGNVCYAISRTTGTGARASFWKSTSSGLFNSWDSTLTINNQINNPTSRVELAVTPFNPSIVYLLCGGVPGVGAFKGLFRSTNSGTSFTLQSNSPNILGRSNIGNDNAQQSNYDLALAVSNNNSTTVITGGVRCWRSLTSGTPGSWDYRGGHHEDVHDLGFHPVGNKLWMANDGGVYSSTDNGENWTSHFTNMSTSQFYRMAVRPDDYLQIISGAQDNGIKRKDGASSTFDHVSGADGFALDYDASNTSIFYAIRNQDVFRYTNDGANVNTITPNPPGNQNNPFSMSLAAHSTLANSLFVGSDSFWRSTNSGNNWNFSLINAGWFIRTSPSNGNRIYAAGGTAYNAGTGILRRSDDGGATWPAANILSNKPGFPVGYPKITSINVHPGNSLQVWITFGGFQDNMKVYYSSDGGMNWVNRSGTLPNLPTNTIAIDQNNNAYVGTDNGVYYRGSSMSDWVPFYNNLPYVPVTDLVISAAEERIRAATFGRGIWTSDLYTGCVANVAVAGTLTGHDFFEASNTVSSTAILQLSEGTKVQMRGGFEVHLLPGFTASETTQFRAVTGPCGSGGVASFSPTSGSTSESNNPENFSANNNTIKPRAIMHFENSNNQQASLLITNKTATDIAFELTGAMGVVVKNWPAENIPAGSFAKNLSLEKPLQTGQYFLKAISAGKVLHQHEWEVRR